MAHKTTGFLTRYNRKIDYVLLAIIIALVLFGLIMVFSASAPTAFYNEGDSYYYLKKQLRFSVVGLVGMFFLANFDYRNIKKMSGLACIISFALMVMVVFIGKSGGGAQRWLQLGPLRFQPSEVAKYAILFYFAKRLSEEKKGSLNNFWHGFMPYIYVLGAFAVSLVLQDHLSGLIVLAMVPFLVLVVGGANMRHVVLLGGVGAVGAGVLAITESYRLDRLMAFLDPFADKLGDGWQIVQGLYAIGSGGLLGRGLGQSREKFLYIPEAHNDYIYAIICEELGFIGAIIVTLLFVLLITRGMKIAMTAPDRFSRLLVFGIFALIGVQVIINLGVVTSSIPNTGMQLPFISYGGTSIVITLCAMGVVLNISRQTKTAGKESAE